MLLSTYLKMIKNLVLKYGLYVAWFQALISMIGSLVFSEFMKFAPCLLCWYQRIAMYPLVLILAIGISRKDKNVVWYALPLSIIGTVIAVYHNLMYYKIIPQEIAPCEIGASCFTKYIDWFGFITIPLLALIAFVIIDVILYLYLTYTKKDE